jgi:hypothetical protein
MEEYRHAIVLLCVMLYMVGLCGGWPVGTASHARLL